MGNRAFSAGCITLMGALITCVLPTLAGSAGSADSCLACHGNREKMREFGYPHFAVTREEAEKQTGMPASCSDCHRGNPGQLDRERATKGWGGFSSFGRRGLLPSRPTAKLPWR